MAVKEEKNNSNVFMQHINTLKATQSALQIAQVKAQGGTIKTITAGAEMQKQTHEKANNDNNEN